ncbi:alpha/beta fold hydrolase [bacterium]
MPATTFTVHDPETVSGLAALFVMDEGPRDATPIVFVHGLGADHYEFIHQIRYFSDKFRCIAFDHRGFGKSPATANMGITRSISDLEALVDHLELDSFILLGHSLGTMVSFEYAADHPDRVEKLIIASGSPAISESLVTYVGLKLMPRLGHLMSDKARKKISSFVGFNIGAFGMRASQDVLRYYFQENHFAFSDKFFKAVIRYMEDIAAFDFRDRLPDIACPTLVTHGALDLGIYALPTLLAVRSIPDARIRVFPTCGHSPNIEAPGEFNTVIEKFIME